VEVQHTRAPERLGACVRGLEQEWRAGATRGRACGQARAAAALERTVVQLGLRTQAQRATGAGLPHLEAGCTQVDVVAGDGEGKKSLLLCAVPCALLGCSGKLVKEEGRGELLGCC
jgi:hypothetical protein